MALNNPCECIHSLRTNAYGLVHVCLCNGTAASLPWKLLRTYLQSYANIMQAVVCHPPSCRLDLARPPPSPDAVRSRNPSKPTLAHDTVAAAAAVLHKHHRIIRVGAGLFQFVYESHSHFAARNFPFFLFLLFSYFCFLVFLNRFSFFLSWLANAH